MDKNANFVLDFSIPQGPTGPTGPNPPACYIDYAVSNNNKNLAIEDYKIFNSNGEFSVNNNILSVEPGTYEITFCGKIDVNEDFQSNITVSLQEDLGGGFSQPINDMAIILSKGTKCMQFSETKLITFSNKKNIMTLISNNNAITVNVTVSMGSLIVKKILIN